MSIISLTLLSFLYLIIPTTQFNQLDFNKFIYYNCSIKSGNTYTETSNYHSNLDTLLSNLTSNTKIDYGFYNSSYGQNPDTVYVIGLCRGDLNPNFCRYCLNSATILLPNKCPNQKEAMGYNDGCIVRYSDQQIFGSYGNPEFSFPYFDPTNATDTNFNATLNDLLQKLAKKAAAGDSRHKFAALNVEHMYKKDLYGLAQCTPDLSEQDCGKCLKKAIMELNHCCNDKIGARIIKLSCNVRYEDYLFYDKNVVDSLQPSPPPPASNHRGLRVWPCELATDNFSVENKLGEGGFGPVYKGRLSSGREIAVKRLSMDSGQGDSEFKNEVSLVAKLQHRNLVKLLGFSLERKERLLVYEFLPNKSLDYLLFDPIKRTHLDWETRYKIIGGIGRGILYLHEDSRLRIIHRDLKASNILLDEEMNPKISDFGMAKLFSINQTQSNTSRIVGTYGYMAPEYAMHGQFSIKSDVFSFGVLVLEIVSGKRNNTNFHEEKAHDLLSFAWKNWREGTASNTIDSLLIDGSRKEMIRCIHIGLLCVQEDIADRPTMANVALMLSSHSFSLPLPSQPAFLKNYRTLAEQHCSGESSSGTTRSTERDATSSIQASSGRECNSVQE
ncbi:cysteine-rich receptor-like protein kinase 19 [Neltuma alba]|uniref:cysteine-rich receptor-like protein kinase 19 n=1 Tax=Neltuma alba TaxID=207710 RepID=UPI0010A32732|nr:cysteine-rich receptor-like protein kinase 19 [Prosopis alba]